MAWLDTEAIKRKFSIQSNAYDTQIGYAIASAALALRKAVDTDVYAEAIFATAPTPTDDLIRYQSVVESHSFLTMYFLVGNVGNKLGELGFIKSAQDAGSPGMSGRMITNSYLTPAEIALMKADFLENAKSNLGEYGTLLIDIETIGASESSLYISSLKWF